jgi:uroporphyrinogen decarboxylase
MEPGSGTATEDGSNVSGMTSRERALAALNHQEPDRVPIDIGGLVLYTCWHEDADAKVKKYLGYETGQPFLNSFISRTVRPDARVRERFQTDFYGLGSKPSSAWELELIADQEGGTWFVDEWQCKWRCPPGGFYYDLIEHPLDQATVTDVARYKWPDPSDEARLEGLAEEARSLYENTDYCLVFTPIWSTGVFQVSGMLQGWENHYVNLLANKKVSLAIFDGLTEFNLAQLETILDSVGDYIQVINLSDDLGFQDRPMIRLSLFQEMVKPFYMKMVNFIKTKRPEVKIVFHSDGAIAQFLPDFIDLGIDAINPVQVGCAGMEDTGRLKREFGDHLAFWGAGVDTQSTLPNGTEEQVRAEVKRRINDLAPGGGYIFAAVHNIQFDVPPENVVACYDAATEFGKYPGNGQHSGAKGTEMNS